MMRRFYLVSTDANEAFKAYLKQKGTVIEVPRDSRVYPAIASHSDIFACTINNRLFIDSELADSLKKNSIALPGKTTVLKGLVKGKYPGTIPFNNRQAGSLVIHHLDHMPEEIRRYCASENLEPVHVNQGYTGCSTLVLDETHLITADRGIAKTAGEKGVDCLIISPGSIRLLDQMEGFIGGAAAVVDGEVLFHGTLESHKDRVKIKGFIEKAGLSWRSLGDMPLTDMGGVVQWQAI